MDAIRNREFRHYRCQLDYSLLSAYKEYRSSNGLTVMLDRRGGVNAIRVGGRAADWKSALRSQTVVVAVNSIRVAGLGRTRLAPWSHFAVSGSNRRMNPSSWKWMWCLSKPASIRSNRGSIRFGTLCLP